MRVDVFALSASLTAAFAGAQAWNEGDHGDAGELPATAQVCTGFGLLSEISGTLDPLRDADAFVIRIIDPAGFSAATVGGTGFDTQLFLFDGEGAGVAANDDEVGGTSLQSRVTGQFVSGPGEHILCVSRYNRDPVNAAGELIWLDSPFRAERRPDGPGEASGDIVLAGWVNSVTLPAGTYQIVLTGCEFAAAVGRADYDGDGFVTGLDFDAFVADFEAGGIAADFDGDGFVTGLDFDAYVVAFEAGC